MTDDTLCNFDRALTDAKSKINYAETQLRVEATALARLLANRLQHVDVTNAYGSGVSALVDLKKQLRRFNIKTRRWDY